MQIEVHHYIHLDPALERKLDVFLSTLVKQGDKIMATLDQLTLDVAAETTVDASVQTLITTLAAEVTAAGTDPVALKALTDKMEANAAGLSALVVANTPATPAGPVVTPAQVPAAVAAASS